MLTIRLQRVGKRNDPSFRVVVTDSQNAAKSGKFVEVVGNYDPRRDASIINTERVRYWLGTGAQVSDTVHNLLVNERLIEGEKKNVLPRKTPIKKEMPEGAKESSVQTEESKVENTAGSEADMQTQAESDEGPDQSEPPKAQKEG